MLGVVTLRKLVFLAEKNSFLPAAILLALFLILFVSEPLISRRFSKFATVYFVVQLGIILVLGLLAPYEDTWGLLYITISIQAMTHFHRQVALRWASLFSVLLLATMVLTRGWIAGLGFGMLYLAGGMLFISYIIAYAQAESARQESQDLLAMLREAYHQLEDTASQAEELAALHERNRLAGELNDSVSQMVFSITLTAQSTRLLLEKNPAQVPAQLERLQELTSSALSQMRTLISQWKPG